jgi:hypothetical protein
MDRNGKPLPEGTRPRRAALEALANVAAGDDPERAAATRELATRVQRYLESITCQQYRQRVLKAIETGEPEIMRAVGNLRALRRCVMDQP